MVKVAAGTKLEVAGDQRDRGVGARVGRDVGEIRALGKPLGLTATDDVDELIALNLDAWCTTAPPPPTPRRTSR